MELVDDALNGGGHRPDGVVSVAVELRVLVPSSQLILRLILLGRLCVELETNILLLILLTLITERQRQPVR